jgi:hypothetical protein
LQTCFRIEEASLQVCWGVWWLISACNRRNLANNTVGVGVGVGKSAMPLFSVP